MTRAGDRPFLPGRETLYRGIKMRSRLEADFAAFLDRAGADWKYEPVCFAGPDGQWLPDFKAKVPGGPWTYFEVKPESLLEGDIDAVLKRMTVTWLTEPQAILQLAIWRFGDPLSSFSIMGFPHEDDEDDDLIWWAAEGDGDMHAWPGMGQLKHFCELARQERLAAEER